MQVTSSQAVVVEKAKNPFRHFRFSDLRGISRLVTQATAGVTGIVEGVHRSVLDTLGVPGAKAPGRTSGITGLVYKAIRDTTQLVGAGADVALSNLQARLDSPAQARAATRERKAVLAVLNGVLGDHLVTSRNPIATGMTFLYRDQSLNLKGLPPMPDATGKVLLLVHGLCMNDQHWQKSNDGGHGETLAAAHGYTPVYLRYNSGLHIAQNGAELSAGLEQLLAHWPVPIEELSIVAHSMGGLLARSAAHHAEKVAMHWPGHLKSIVFLGTPHHGAPLERVGNWIDLLLGSTPYSRPFTALGCVRSAGITDLRHGYVLDPGGTGKVDFQHLPDSSRVVPLPGGVACYAVAATVTARRGVLANHLVGDGLVPVQSALGRHSDLGRNLLFATSKQRIVFRTNHLQLLDSPEVSRQLQHWLCA